MAVGQVVILWRGAGKFPTCRIARLKTFLSFRIIVAEKMV
jgi:hypothetical protein